MKLKYLFTAYFADGSVIEQDQHDISRTVPTKSAFFDVLNHPSPLHHFSLTSDIGTSYSVDLYSGKFTVNGSVFEILTASTAEDVKKNVLFFRRHRHQFNGQAEEIAHEIEFHLGWRADVGGRNIEASIILE